MSRQQVSLGKQTYEDKKWELERRELPCETEVLRAAHSQKAHEAPGQQKLIENVYISLRL